MQNLKIGTRGSKLALAQAHTVKSQLEKSFPEITCEIEVIRTIGDIDQKSILEKLPNYGKGVFTREIDDALLNNQIDIAVHSLKDVPTDYMSELMVGAVLKRDSPWDAMISSFRSIQELPINARIGTSSIRRKSELLRLNPKFRIIPIRGNIETRIKKLESLDAVVTAEAAIRRIRIPILNKYSITIFSKEEMLPCPGQGAIAVSTKVENAYCLKLLRELDDLETRYSVTAERTFLKEFGGGCVIPLGAIAIVQNKRVKLFAAVNSPDGISSLRMAISDHLTNSEQLGRNLAKKMKEKGANQLIS